MRFRADQHLRRAADFLHVRNQGRRYDCGAFVLFHAKRAATDDADTLALPARAGFVASRAAVGNAIERARAKRRLREQFRLHQTAFPAGIDLVFIARRSLNRLESAELNQRFSNLCRHFLPSRET